jgi:branched-chain amino acid transport system substrate-binding protein
MRCGNTDFMKGLKMKLSRAIAGLGACVLLAVTGCASSDSGSSNADSKEPIKIGMIFPLSGALAQGGQRNVQGIQIAVDQVNAAGGVLGRKIQLVSTDAPDPATAVSNANRLISQDGVKIIMGSVSSDIALAAAPVADRNKVVFWEVQAVSNKLTGLGYKYVFRTVAPASALGEAAANYALGDVAAKLGKDKSSLRVAVMNIQGSYGEDTTKGVVDTLTAAGVTPADKSDYPGTTKDLTSLILKQKQANPDVVIATSYPPDTILYMKQAAQLGFHPKAYIGTGAGQTTAQFLEGVGDGVQGVLSAASPAKINPSQLSPNVASAASKFAADYKAKYNTDPDQGAILAYVGALDLINGVIAKAGAVDPDKMRTAALALDQPLGTSINGWGAKFDETGQNTRASVIIVQWQDKVMQIVSPKELSSASLQTVTPSW